MKVTASSTVTTLVASVCCLALHFARVALSRELTPLPHDKRHGTLPLRREQLRPGKKSGVDEIVVVGGVDGRLYAFDLYSGRELWSTGTNANHSPSNKGQDTENVDGADGSAKVGVNDGAGSGVDGVTDDSDGDEGASTSTDLVTASWAQTGSLDSNPTVSGQAVIPGLDGSLILLEQQESDKKTRTLKLSRLSMSVEDVVRQTPFQTALRPHDADLQEPELSVVGTRDSKVLGISARSGAVRFKIGTFAGAVRFDQRARDKCFEKDADAGVDDSGGGGGDDDDICTREEAPEEEDIIWLGMADYTVRAFDAQTMQERWNFSTSVFKGSAKKGQTRGAAGKRGAVRFHSSSRCRRG